MEGTDKGVWGNFWSNEVFPDFFMVMVVIYLFVFVRIVH